MAVSIDEAYIIILRRVVEDAETFAFNRVTKRLARGIDGDPNWADRRLAEVRAMNKEIGDGLKDLRAETGTVEERIIAASKNGAAQAIEELQSANLLHPSLEGAEMARGRTLRLLVSKAVNVLEASHFQILRTANDVYRSTIAEAVSQSATGVMTRKQAAQTALNRFADKGIRGFVDKAGRQWDIASYTEMATRTSLAQASVEGHLASLEAHGHDLVIVSSSTEACESCYRWEGKVLSIGGMTEGYPTLEQAKSGSHLFGPNCTHSTGIYIKGMTRKPEIVPAKDRRRDYNQRQQQRYNERGIRHWKKREAVALDENERASARAQVQAWQAKQRAFIEETDRRRDYGRESIVAAR